ncbi:keratin, type II cytoskeletal 8-like [Mobula hypostoma]|uniref:keratin, type II cytoskeletal 8-like n=1 Tax=Mobula hypostoma TaxID=723540 RepID=UPI002FC2E5A4
MSVPYTQRSFRQTTQLSGGPSMRSSVAGSVGSSRRISSRKAMSVSGAGIGTGIGGSRRMLSGSSIKLSSGYNSGYGSGYGSGLRSNFSSSSMMPALDLSAPLPQNDTSLQQVRMQETRELTTLNNQFASFINQVRLLEQQNAQLKVKLELLKRQGTYTSNIDNMFQTYIDNLKRQLETLGQEKLKFESDLVQMQGLVEDFKGKYEDEINKRTEMENEFVMVKKDVDESYMNKVELEAKLESLTDEIEFLKTIFQEEIRELESQIQNTAVSVQVDTSRNLNIDQIISEVKAQYQSMADKCRDDAENWKKAKMVELSTMPGGHAEEVRVIKSECNDLQNRIRKLTGDIEYLKQQRLKLEAAIAEAEERGEMSLKDSKQNIVDLQEAIRKAKQEIAKQTREIDELINVKLALDIEINTYSKLLAQEEIRMVEGVKTLSVQQVSQQGNYGNSAYQSGLGAMETSRIAGQRTESSKNILVKTVEQLDGVTVSSTISALQ